jgi:hypothetical protein
MQRAAGELAAGADECLDAQGHVLRQLLDREPAAEIVRNAVETAAMHDARAAGARERIVAQPHAIDELRLASEIDIVGAGLRAGGDEFLAVADVGPDRGDDHARRRRQLRQPRGIVGIGRQQRQCAAMLGDVSEPRAHHLELVGAAAGERPAQFGAAMPREVLRRQLAGETGRAEQYDIVRTLADHECRGWDGAAIITPAAAPPEADQGLKPRRPERTSVTRPFSSVTMRSSRLEPKL